MSGTSSTPSPRELLERILADECGSRMIDGEVNGLRRQLRFRRHDPADLLGRVHLGLLRRLGSYRPERGHLRAWTKVALRSVVISLIREENTRRRAFMRSMFSIDTVDASGQRLLDRIATSPESGVDRLVNGRTVQQVFDALPPELKEHIRHLIGGVKRKAAGLSLDEWRSRTEALRWILADAGFDLDMATWRRADERRRRRT